MSRTGTSFAGLGGQTSFFLGPLSPSFFATLSSASARFCTPVFLSPLSCTVTPIVAASVRATRASPSLAYVQVGGGARDHPDFWIGARVAASAVHASSSATHGFGAGGGGGSGAA